MRKMMFLLLIMSVFAQTGWGQELACRVTVSTKGLQGETVDKSIFNALEQNLSSFINDRKWTNYNYKVEEKIDCNIQIEVERSKGNDTYEGNLRAQLSRPVFNSLYYSPLFTYEDHYITFRYSANQTFEYDENSYIWTVTSLAAFYANLFLALSYDAQSLYGGTVFYNKCQSILNSAPSNEPGWSNASKEKRNRYWLLESYTNPANENVRKFLYTYHREGLDVMATDINGGLNNITSAIEQLQQLYMRNPTSVSVAIICLAKSVEFVNVYSGAPLDLKQKVVPLLSKMDPPNTDKYSKLVQR